MLDDYRWYLPGYQQAASVRIRWFWMTCLVKWGGVALRSESWNQIAEPIIIDNRVRTYFIIYGIIIMWRRRQSSTRFSTMANEVFWRENWGSVYPQAGYCCTKTRSKYCNSRCLSGPWIRQAYCRASWGSKPICLWMGCLGCLADWRWEICVSWPFHLCLTISERTLYNCRPSVCPW